MNERDIRSAFDHLTQDVMMTVQTEERLEEITQSRRASRRPLLTAFASAAAVALVVGGVLVLLRPAADPEAEPPATAGPTTTVTDSTSAPTTTGPTTEAPAPTMPLVEPGMVVIADRSAPAFTAGAGYVTYLADLVVGDGAQGVVIQIDQRIIHILPTGEGRDLVSAEDIAADGGSVTIQLQDLVRIDGEAQVLYVVSGGGVEQPYEEVWTYNLESDASMPIYRRDEFESTIQRVSLANDTMVVTVAEEGTTYFEVLNAAGQPIDVAVPIEARRGTDFFSPVVQGAVSPDGSTLAYVQIVDVTTAEDGYLFADLVVWDLANGGELQRLEIELRDDGLAPWPGRLDYDGVGVVLGRYRNLVEGPEGLAPLRIASLDAGDITELDTAGAPSLIKYGGGTSSSGQADGITDPAQLLLAFSGAWQAGDWSQMGTLASEQAVAEAQSVFEPGATPTVVPETIRSVVGGCRPHGDTTRCEVVYGAPGGTDAQPSGLIYYIDYAGTPAGLIVTQLTFGGDAG